MFAGVAEPDLDAMMNQHFLVECADQRELLVERRGASRFPVARYRAS